MEFRRFSMSLSIGGNLTERKVFAELKTVLLTTFKEACPRMVTVSVRVGLQAGLFICQPMLETWYLGDPKPD